jgi:porin-like protein
MLDLPPPAPSIEFVLAGRGYSKGLAQTDGAQALIRGEVHWGPLFAAAQWKNVNSSGADSEAQIQIGVGGEAGGFDLEAAVGYKRLAGLPAADGEDAVEFTASARSAFGPVEPRLALTFSFDDLGATRRSLYAEAGASLRIAPRTRLSAHVGRRERGGGDDYTAFGAGISQQIGEHITAELRWHDSASSARGDAYEGRAVASLRLRF